MKNVYISILLIVFILTAGVMAEGEDRNNLDAEQVDTIIKHTTIKGELYLEGTDTKNYLILKDDNEKSYLIQGDYVDVLKKMRGIPLILTGAVVEEDKANYDYSIIVYYYNTDFPKYKRKAEDVSVMGLLLQEADTLILLTPDYYVVYLEGSYDFIEDYVGQKVVINGDLKLMGLYKAELSIKSYLPL